jgi:PAS domain S-box-containing protein
MLEQPKSTQLNDVLITEELYRRVPRQLNLHAENQAMRSLARQLAQDPERMLQHLVDLAVELCAVGTAGVSLVETQPDGETVFRWVAMAGLLASHVGGCTPRNFSPCGVCLEQGAAVLFAYPERYFTYLQTVNTPLVEGLVLPLIADGQALGAIWIVTHDQQRQFDGEDVRLMTGLADFTVTLLRSQQQARELLVVGTALKEEATERQLAEDWAQALINNLPGGAAFVVDRDLRYLTAAGEALESTDFEPNDFIGRTIFEVLSPELAASYEPMYRQALAGESFEHEHQSHDRWYISRGTPLLTEDGEIYAVLAVSYDITDRKQTEAALRESETRFRQVFDNNMVAMGIWTPAGTITDANDALLDLIGYTRADLEAGAIRWTELTPPEYHDRDLQAIAEVRAKGACIPYEKEFIHKAGYRQPILIGSGRFDECTGTGIFCAFDLSNLKQAEAALHKSEEKYRALFDSMDEAYAVVEVMADDNGVWNDFLFLEVNPAFVKQTGMEYPVGRKVTELLGTPNPRWAEVYGRVAETGEPIRFEEGEATLGRVFDLYVFRLGGDGSRRVAVLFTDITNRKQAEATIIADLRDTQLLRELSVRLASEADIQVLYNEIMAAAIGLTRADAGTVQIFDEATQDLVLLATQGFDPNVIAHFHRVNVSSQTSCGLALRSGQRAFIDFDDPERDDPDGSLQIHLNAGYRSAQSTPLITRSGRPIGMVSTHWCNQYRPTERELRFLDLLARQAADLIEQRRAELEQRQLLEREQAAREQAETANRIKDEFLAVLSHELRSPLNPILGWSKLLRQGKLDPARTQTALDTIDRNAQLQVQLIDDLLDISRILRGKLRLNETPVDLSMVILAALETVRLAVEAKSLQIETILSPDVGAVMGDIGRLQQVVWNLLSNAVKFTPQGGQITVALTQAGTHAQIQVADTGKGINPDFLPYVFEHFRQEDGATTRKFGGLGLGLAIASQIIEMHGGQIRVDSPGEGQGATFTVQLPLAPHLSELPSKEASSTSTSDLNSIHVLVVDDEPDSRDFVAFVLEQANARVTTVASGIGALQAFSQSIPDLIVSDIGMPEMDGYMLLRQIRTLSPEEGGQIPAIALTAYAGELDRQQAVAAGFQCHIAKPIDPGKLVQTIAAVIGRA